MKRLLLVTMLAALLSGSAAFAQTPSVSSPGVLPTSPLGVQGSRPVGPAGIPFGATELGTAGVSPAPFGVGGAVPCSAAGSVPSGMSGTSTSTFNGGGTGMGSATGMSAAYGTTPGNGVSPCAGGSASAGGSAAYVSSPSTIAPGGTGRLGIPLGSTEIGNAGVSGVPAIPTPSATPSNILPGSSTCPTNGTSSGGIPATAGFPGVC